MKTIESLVEFAEAVEAGKTIIWIGDKSKFGMVQNIDVAIEAIANGNIAIKTDPVTLYEYKLMGGHKVWSPDPQLSKSAGIGVNPTGESGVLT